MSNVAINLMVKYRILNETIGKENVKFNKKENKLTFEYPCLSSTNCTEYEVTFFPGIYEISMYGASGGGKVSKELKGEEQDAFLGKYWKFSCVDDHEHESNVECIPDYSVSGAGGFISGKIQFKELTKGFLVIGGQGVISPYKIGAIGLGGYNGGGFSKSNTIGSPSPASSGGGSTDLRIDLNDIYHRILVCGGGGGSDDQTGDDGRGGAGGGLEAQGGQYKDHNFSTENISTQTSGYSFYYGGSAKHGEQGGGGSGWYGGYEGYNNDFGAGGGSSFALGENKTITLPDQYSFQHGEYQFYDVHHERGVRGGNGQINITLLESFYIPTKQIQRIRQSEHKNYIYNLGIENF